MKLFYPGSSLPGLRSLDPLLSPHRHGQNILVHVAQWHMDLHSLGSDSGASQQKAQKKREKIMPSIKSTSMARGWRTPIEPKYLWLQPSYLFSVCWGGNLCISFILTFVYSNLCPVTLHWQHVISLSGWSCAALGMGTSFGIWREEFYRFPNRCWLCLQHGACWGETRRANSCYTELSHIEQASW